MSEPKVVQACSNENCENTIRDGLSEIYPAYCRACLAAERDRLAGELEDWKRAYARQEEQAQRDRETWLAESKDDKAESDRLVGELEKAQELIFAYQSVGWPHPSEVEAERDRLREALEAIAHLEDGKRDLSYGIAWTALWQKGRDE